ncbi:helix-turn-helix transcriptional regulator [Ancylomarina longa]|uniref:XRE family transcriptional regulator n=1 Tax=Ancylomarina longa TaxID=2487017 RepID=A0A434AYW0_9BACT|nr:helix-turn-helix transcriptional regulator [Ancylomarina longa]RUT79780.1 XRE family transcriptional regulator [Ancylomarina longa]
MKNRIVQLLNSEGLTSSKFADTIGVQRSSISHILSGRNNPSTDFIQKVMKAFPKVNGEWLLLGIGSMYKTQNANSLFETEPNEKEIHLETPVIQPPKINRENQLHSENVKEPILEMNSFVPGKQIEKVVVFYTDKTFKEYNPS